MDNSPFPLADRTFAHIHVKGKNSLTHLLTLTQGFNFCGAERMNRCQATFVKLTTGCGTIVGSLRMVGNIPKASRECKFYFDTSDFFKTASRVGAVRTASAQASSFFSLAPFKHSEIHSGNRPKRHSSSSTIRADWLYGINFVANCIDMIKSVK